MNTEIDAAIQVLKNGGIILYPTDTVWGIGCDATNEKAVAKVFELKKRTDSKSLITLVSDADMLCKYVKEIPEIALSLIEVNDQPMTIIYPGAIGLAANVIAEDGSVGIRIPMNEFCSKLIYKFRRPIVSTSANFSGEKTPAYYKDISIDIIKAVDWVANPHLENISTGRPSQIIKVSLSGEIKIIRE